MSVDVVDCAKHADAGVVPCTYCGAEKREPCRRWWPGEYHWTRHAAAWNAVGGVNEP